MLSESIANNLEKLQKLPPLPNLAQLILNFSYDDTDIREFSNVIETNSTLTVKLLKLANSAYFGWPQEIRSVEEAIIKVLGLAQAKGLVIVSILKGLFKSDSRLFNLERYWFNNITCGILAQSLFKHLPNSYREEIDNVYIHGLLHNIGLIALVHCFPAEIDKILSCQEKQGCGINARCEEAFGIGYHRLGGMLAAKWHLPKDITATIAYHNQEDYRKTYWPIVLLIGLCAEYADAVYRGVEINSGHDVASAIGLNSVDAEKERLVLISQIEELKEMATLFGSN